MFSVGDAVCYPMHGVGTIEAIEEQQVLGKTAEYYILRFVNNRVTAMVPVEMAERVGLRDIISAKEGREVIEYFKTAKPGMGNSNWNQRYHDNMDKLKLGTPKDVADVILCLSKRSALKGLSSGERRMLATARTILVTELAMALSSDEAEIEEKLELV